MYVILNDAKGRHRHTVPVSAFAHCTSDGLLLLELTGVDTQNRAVWANIVKHRPERTLTLTDAIFQMGQKVEPIGVIPTTKYHKVERPGRVLLLHDGLTRFQMNFLLGGSHDQPSPWFAAALQATVPLPVLDHWITPLWKAAIAEKLLLLAQVIAGPVNVWRLSHETATWRRMISRMVYAKMLTVEA